MGCGKFEDRAPSDGYATATSHIRGNGTCSSEYMEHEIWRMKRLGFSHEYIDRFAKAYQKTCDRHWEDVRRQRQAKQ